MMWNHWGPSGMGWGFFGGMHLLWWLLLFAAAIAVWRLAAGPRSRSHGDGAESILRERYGRGEIDHAEFEQRLRELRR